MENKKKRSYLYRTRRLVEIDGAKLTVNEANELYVAYVAEGNVHRSTEIQNAIVLIKNQIRQQYPD